VRHRIVVDPGCRQSHRPEDQTFDSSGKWKARLFLHDESEKVVGGVLFMQEFRSGFEKERTPLDPGDEAGRSLMMLKNIVVI
jgi:hypothetical protein